MADKAADKSMKENRWLLENPYRKDFPIFRSWEGAYLDSAATAQRPACVIQAEQTFYERHNANPLRGFYDLSLEATDCYEKARRAVQEFLHAAHPEEIIFTRNTTESLNLVAYSYGLHNLHAGDEIVVSILEHHSNLLPWQMVSARTGAALRFLECGPDGTVTDEQLSEAITERTKLVAVAQVSNVLGSLMPIEKIVKLAHEQGAAVILDAAQSAPHLPISVQELNVDFLAFSGHKLMGPMGIGVLYGRRELLEKMPPFLTGGEMIASVSRREAVFAPLPQKFEAGTVNAAGAAGLQAAIEYLQDIGFEEIQRREEKLTEYVLRGMEEIPHIHVLGSKKAKEHCGIITFTVDGVHSHDVSSILDTDHVAVRAGHHCAQPLMEYLGVPAAVRASLYLYNTAEDADRFLQSVSTVRRRMGYGE